MLFILAALLLLFIGNAPLGHGQILGGGIVLNSTQININGKLFCTPNGNFEVGASGAGGVAVSATLSLNNTSVFTAGGKTGPGGLFNLSIVVDNVVDVVVLLVTGQNPTSITVQLPVKGTNCTAFPPTGRLVSIPSLLNVNVTRAGDVVRLEGELFKWIPI